MANNLHFKIGSPNNIMEELQSEYGTFYLTKYEENNQDSNRLYIGTSNANKGGIMPITAPTPYHLTIKINGQDDNSFVELNEYDGSENATVNLLINNDGVYQEGSIHAVVHYAICNTSAEDQNKTTDITGYQLIPGARAHIKFLNTNVASNPTLDISGSGPRAISFNNKLPLLIANVIYTFIYDGVNYVLLDENHRVDGLGGNYAEVFNDPNNIASGKYAHAEGSSNEANGDYSHVEGISSIAEGLASHAEGNSSSAEGEASHAEGYQSIAIGTYSHAEGSSVAFGNHSHSEGQASSAFGNVSHAEGSETIANGDYSHAEGINTEASGNASHAEGGNLTEDGTNVHPKIPAYINWDDSIEILGTTAMGVLSHAEGSQTLAYGYASHAEGQQSSASGESSHAEGMYTLAMGDFSHAEGEWAMAEGYCSHAEGQWVVAKGKFSHAEGVETLAKGYGSHAEGGNMSTEGIPYPSAALPLYHWEGSETYEINSTTAEGDHSHAEGIMTLAYGDSSHAEGDFTVASGESSHAEGSGTLASGTRSHAEGGYTTASGWNSHAEGFYTLAYSDYQHVQGQYNIEDTEDIYAHIVGNGNWETRSNAHTLDWNGNAWFSGDIYVGSTSGTNKDEGSKRVLTEVDLENYTSGTQVQFIIWEAND